MTINKPEPFDTFSAKNTATPFCVVGLDSTGELLDHYFSCADTAERHRANTGGIVFEVDRETGQWNQ